MGLGLIFPQITCLAREQTLPVSVCDRVATTNPPIGSMAPFTMVFGPELASEFDLHVPSWRRGELGPTGLIPDTIVASPDNGSGSVPILPYTPCPPLPRNPAFYPPTFCIRWGA